MKLKKSSKTGRRRCLPAIPHEILTTEVLPRVQAKSLLRFKSVCKAWRDVINDPNFIQTQLLNYQSRSNQQLNVLFTDFGNLYSIVIKSSVTTSKTEVAKNPLPLKMFKPCSKGYPRFWGSCNGLICVQTEEFSLGLWNPCTGSYRALHYRPLHGLTTFGFGYDAKIKDYKLVGIRRITRRVRVLTLNSNSRRRISDANYLVSPQPGKFIDGVLYWIDHGELRPDKLICFDIHAEVFSELRLPDSDSSPTEVICKIEISDIGGCLALVRNRKCSSVIHEVWVMKENWIKMYSVDVSTRHWVQNVTPLGGININNIEIEKKNGKKEKHVDRVIYMGTHGHGYRLSFSFNPSTKQFVQFSLRNTFTYVRYESIITYDESLVLVNQ